MRPSARGRSPRYHQHSGDHSDVAIRVNNIADVLQARGDLAGALAKYQEAFAILLRVYGPRGQNVATVAGNLLALGADPIERARGVAGDAAAEVLQAELAEYSRT